MDLVSLQIDAEGEVEEHLDRTSWFKTVTLRPKIVVKGKSQQLDVIVGPNFRSVVLYSPSAARRYDAPIGHVGPCRGYPQRASPMSARSACMMSAGSRRFVASGSTKAS